MSYWFVCNTYWSRQYFDMFVKGCNEFSFVSIIHSFSLDNFKNRGFHTTLPSFQNVKSSFDRYDQQSPLYCFLSHAWHHHVRLFWRLLTQALAVWHTRASKCSSSPFVWYKNLFAILHISIHSSSRWSDLIIGVFYRWHGPWNAARRGLADDWLVSLTFGVTW